MSVHMNRYSLQLDLVVTTDQYLYILTEMGKIRYQRRLDFTPSCLCTYHLNTPGSDIYEDESRSRMQVMSDAQIPGHLTNSPCFMLMLGSFDNAVMIIKDVRIVWEAKTQVPPVFISRSDFEQ
jgi:hypothetical protein